MLLAVRKQFSDCSHFHRCTKKEKVDYELKAAQLSLSKCEQSCYILLLCDLFLEIPQGHLEDRLYRQFLSLHLGISLILQRLADRIPGTTLNRLCVIALQAESRLGFIDWLRL